MTCSVICGIYKITSPTGRIYVGESKDIIKRWKDYGFLNCKKQIRIYNSFMKHGVENHIFEIIEECEIGDLNCRERYWQDHYDVLNGGLNCKLTKCGDIKQVHSEETRMKISKSNLTKHSKELNSQWGKFGKDSALYGIPRTKEVKLKISKSKMGKPNKGFENISEEYLKQLSIRSRGNKSTSRLVLDLCTGIYYTSAKEASEAYNINYFTLIDYLKGKYPNKSNLKWA